MEPERKIRVYFAGPMKFVDKIRETIEEAPSWIESTSRWVDPEFQAIPSMQQKGNGDLSDIDRAHAIIVFTSSIFGWGHAFEAGYALAQGKRVYLIPCGVTGHFSVFHHVSWVDQVPDVHHAYRSLAAFYGIYAKAMKTVELPPAPTGEGSSPSQS